MNTKYFLYALLVTAVTTIISWSTMIDSSSTSRGRGSSWSTGSGSGGFGGGGHK